MNIKNLYTIAAAAELCGVSKPTLYSAVTRGSVTSVSTGCGRRLVKLADVKKFVNAMTS